MPTVFDIYGPKGFLFASTTDPARALEIATSKGKPMTIQAVERDAPAGDVLVEKARRRHVVLLARWREKKRLRKVRD